MKQLNIILLFFLVMLMSMSCQTKRTQSLNVAVFDTQAHRGGRGLMPENTIPAMLDAIDRGVYTLELDLQVSKDKQVIVSHDPYFNEKITTTPDGKYLTKKESRKALLYEMTYPQIERYDVGVKTNPDFPLKKNIEAQIPLLSELIKETERYAKDKNRVMHYNIEIKTTKEGDGIQHPTVDEFVDLALDVIKAENISERTMIQSFDPRVLQLLYQKYPAMTTSYLVNYREKKSVSELIESLGFTPNVYSPDYRHVTLELVNYCHFKNIKVIPWTVNDIDTMKGLKTMGVDGVITDYPDLFEKL